MPREHISKRTRFEIFKRDQFTCQYCGDHPPKVILHIDHIVAVANGGASSIDNLVTACDGCNLGKSDVPLSSIPQSLADKAALIEEAEEQLRGYHAIIQAKESRLDGEVWQVWEIFEPGAKEMRRDYFRSIRRFIETLGVFAVKNSMDAAVNKFYFRPSHSTFKYFCGICWNKIKRDEQGRL